MGGFGSGRWGISRRPLAESRCALMMPNGVGCYPANPLLPLSQRVRWNVSRFYAVASNDCPRAYEVDNADPKRARSDASG